MTQPQTNGERVHDNLYAEHPFDPRMTDVCTEHGIVLPTMRTIYSRLVTRHYKEYRNVQRIEEDVTLVGFLNNRKVGDARAGTIIREILKDKEEDLSLLDPYLTGVVDVGLFLRSYKGWAEYLEKNLIKMKSKRSKQLFNVDGSPKHHSVSLQLGVLTYRAQRSADRLPAIPEVADLTAEKAEPVAKLILPDSAYEGLEDVLPDDLRTTSIVNRTERNNARRRSFNDQR